MVDLLFSRPAGLLLGRRTRRMYMNEMDLITKCAQNANGKLVKTWKCQRERNRQLSCCVSCRRRAPATPPPPSAIQERRGPGHGSDLSAGGTGCRKQEMEDGEHDAVAASAWVQSRPQQWYRFQSRPVRGSRPQQWYVHSHIKYIYIYAWWVMMNINDLKNLMIRPMS